MISDPLQARNALAETVLATALLEEIIQQRLRQIYDHVLTHSSYLQKGDFATIHPRDLECLFSAYDDAFFGGLCRRALNGRSLNFRLSSRMTRTGGTTARLKTRNGEVLYEISIGVSMLFDGFGDADRRVSVCGLECESRLQALQRIFEHEMVHLIEQLCWENSNCRAQRFQSIAARFFSHRAHTHNLVTRRERAAQSGIRVGSCVTFTFEGQQLIGRVNRITKRATVLVKDPAGQTFSDGLRYKVYYVPTAALKLVLVEWALVAQGPPE